MSWPFKDYDFYGDRYVNITDPSSVCGEIMWYDRDIDRDNTPTECVICIEAENEMYTKYAHPKAHSQSHKKAGRIAEKKASKRKNTDDYLDYYTFYYGREYNKLYKDLYTKYKLEYSSIVLEKTYTKADKICNHHSECIQYHYERT